MGLLLYGLLFLACTVLALAVIAVLGWWLRYALVVGYLLLPPMMLIWGAWAFFVAIPMGLLFDGTPAERRIVRISHWLNEECAALLWFALTLPFKAFALATAVAAWLLG